jgi:hypothetical protein
MGHGGIRMGETGFNDQLWNELSRKTAKAFRMWPWTAAKLKKNRTARLIAALPFIAGCEHPERTALAHLATFVLASSESCKRVFDHDASDNASPTARLAPIADFQGGDRAVIEEGMARLAMIMANGYQKDLEKDKASGEYNPILAGAWKHETLAETFRTSSREKGSSPLDSVMTSDDALRDFWKQ